MRHGEPSPRRSKPTARRLAAPCQTVGSTYVGSNPTPTTGARWSSATSARHRAALPGSVRITGLDQAGRPVTTTYTSRISGVSSYSTPTTAPLILSPRMGSIPDGLLARYGFPPPPAGLAGAITLRGRYGPASSGQGERPAARAGWSPPPGGWRSAACRAPLRMPIPQARTRSSRPAASSSAGATCPPH